MNREEQIDDMRRKLSAWIPASVIAVSLPAHAQTSFIPEQPPEEPPTDDCIGDECEPDDPPCVGDECEPDDPPCTDDCEPDDPPPSLCDDKPHKVEICHHPRGKEPHEICVAKPAVRDHIEKHGDYVGSCK